MTQGPLSPASCGALWGSWTGQAPSMLCRAPALPAISAGEWANGISARRGQGQGRTADLPLFRSSVIPRALTWKRLQQPSSRASTPLTAILRTFNTHNKCIGVCRFVRGFPVGIRRHVADLWGFCGPRKIPLTCLATWHGNRKLDGPLHMRRITLRRKSGSEGLCSVRGLRDHAVPSSRGPGPQG